MFDDHHGELAQILLNHAAFGDARIHPDHRIGRRDARRLRRGRRRDHRPGMLDGPDAAALPEAFGHRACRQQDFAVMIDPGHKADQGLMPHRQGSTRAAAESPNGTALQRGFTDSGQQRFSTQFSTQRGNTAESRSYFSWSWCPSWSDRSEFVTSFPSWKCGFDSGRPLSDLSAVQPVCRGSISDDSRGVRSTAHATYMPHPYAVRSQLSWRKPGAACSLDRGQAANYLISRVNEGVYRINLADRSDHVLLLPWVSKIQGPQNEQHSPLPEHLGT